MDWNSVLALLADPKLLALLSPMLVSLIKKATDALPKWSLPLLSVVIGAVASAVGGGTVASGAMAGAMGVAVREIVDQAKKAAAPAAK